MNIYKRKMFGLLLTSLTSFLFICTDVLFLKSITFSSCIDFYYRFIMRCVLTHRDYFDCVCIVFIFLFRENYILSDPSYDP